MRVAYILVLLPLALSMSAFGAASTTATNPTAKPATASPAAPAAKSTAASTSQSPPPTHTIDGVPVVSFSRSAPDYEKPSDLPKEERAKLGAIYEKMTLCIRGPRPLKDCREEFYDGCKTMASGRCGPPRSAGFGGGGF